MKSSGEKKSLESASSKPFIPENSLSENALLEQAAHWFITMQEQPNCVKQQQALKRWLMNNEHQSAWQHICQVDKFFSPVKEKVSDRLATQTLLSSSSEASRNMSRRGAIKGLFSLAVTAVCTWQLSPWINKRWHYAQADYSTTIGETASHLLADGSQLSLNTHSAVNVNFSGNARRLILLQGEIAITTANNLANNLNNSTQDLRRFFVDTSLADQAIVIEALGTEFTVRKMSDKIIVNVQSGQVALTANKQRYLINQGEQLHYGKQGTRQMGGKISSLNKSVNDWQQGKFTAYNLPLVDLCHELSRYTPALISVDDNIANIKVVGTFPVGDMAQSMELLAASLPIELTQRTQWWWLLSAK